MAWTSCLQSEKKEGDKKKEPERQRLKEKSNQPISLFIEAAEFCLRYKSKSIWYNAGLIGELAANAN